LLLLLHISPLSCSEQASAFSMENKKMDDDDVDDNNKKKKALVVYVNT